MRVNEDTHYIVAEKRMGEFAARMRKAKVKPVMGCQGDLLTDLILEHPLFPQRDIKVVVD